MSISEVALQQGLRPSAIRYYEHIGILTPVARVSGQRRYDRTILERLAVIQHAQRAGFTLAEIKQIFFGFRPGTCPSQRWRKLAKRKLAELKELTQPIEAMRRLLQGMCNCKTLPECGETLLVKDCSNGVKPTRRAGVSHRRRAALL
jgi:MerR family transcriptional regulator, redox-sensitive transcriptional activator SoxR